MDAIESVAQVVDPHHGDDVMVLSGRSPHGRFQAFLTDTLSQEALRALRTDLQRGPQAVGLLQAGVQAVEARLRRVHVDPSRPTVSIASHGGARRVANLVPLVAGLAAIAGVQVVVHGIGEACGRTTTARIMKAMGLLCPPELALARGDPAFVPVAALWPGLASMLERRGRIGQRALAGMLAQLVDPTDSPRCLIVACNAHPGGAALQRAYFRASGRSALLLRGTEGEAVVDARQGQPIDWVHDGGAERLDARGAVHGGSPLPDPGDASATARWIQSVLAGERPVPLAIAHQVAALLQAAGTRPAAVGP
jgi:anthranilate phosphoribosyltransferase